MIEVTEPTTTVVFDTPAGQIRCDVEVIEDRIGSVTFENVESFLLKSQIPLRVDGMGSLTVDIAYGGDLYTIVDADEIGLELGINNDACLIEAWARIRTAVAEQIETVHPYEPRINRCYQVLFTSNQHKKFDYRQTIAVPPGTLDRSPCGTGTSARLAMLFQRQEVEMHERRSFEGPLGTCFTGKVIGAEERNGITFVRPTITGRAFITGYHNFVLDPEDPIPTGYRVGPAAAD
tara:strand:+ start:23826 stop:24527 length:702 start_codon:yes stop_codon:yes gene_type:complete